MARFADALNRSAEDIRRPPPLPLGHYICTVPRVPDPAEEMNSSKGSYEKLTIPVQVVSALDDVEPEELEAFGNPSGTPLRLDFIFNCDPAEEAKFEGTLNRLKEFLAKAGVDISRGTLGEWLTELPGAQFVAEVSHRPDPNDAAVVYAEIKRTTSA